MSEGQSQRSVASSAQHRQEAEVAAAETAATTVRAARLVMAELAATRAEVEAAVATDAACATAAELKALRGSSTNSSVSADDELKHAKEAVREQAA
jgi:Tfp pilus assembly major pilin PilA